MFVFNKALKYVYEPVDGTINQMAGSRLFVTADRTAEPPGQSAAITWALRCDPTVANAVNYQQIVSKHFENMKKHKVNM